MTAMLTRCVGPATRRIRQAFLLLCPVLAANTLIFTHTTVPVVSPVLGTWTVLVLPALLVYTKLSFRATPGPPRAVLSLALTVALLMLVGLALNFGLAAVGVKRPLDTVPITLGVDGLVLGLFLFRWNRLPSPRLRLPTSNPETRALTLLASISVVLAVAGAVRLNNGRGSSVTVAMLCLDAVILVRLMGVRRAVSDHGICAIIYLTSLSLLLMTSLRGWYNTGHDIQREYGVFELVNTNGNWSPHRLRDAYNACLSITILPTMLLKTTGLPDAYVYKVAFQLIFAACPVAVYLVARQFSGRLLAILAVVYFISFPTFFIDMPYLNRQEVGFLFLSACLLVIVADNLPRKHARLWLTVFIGGLVVAHYSTAYVFAAVLLFTWWGRKSLAVAKRLRRRADHLQARAAADRRVLHPRAGDPVVSVANVIVIVALSLLWYGPITQANSGLASTLVAAGKSLVGTDTGAKSSDVGYGLLSSGTVSPQERLKEYEAVTTRETEAGRRAGDYYPLAFVNSFKTPDVPVPDLPLTSTGKALSSAHIPVKAVNSFIRQGIARLLQLLVLIGLLGVAVRRLASDLKVTSEFYALGWFTFAVVALQVLVPVLSVEYGVLRAFQQALFILAPFIAAGGVILFRPFGRRARAGASALVVAIFVSTSGLLPQVTGGYPAQLNLNNSGLYYDIYYVHPEEVAGIDWVRQETVSGAVQSEVQTDRYTFNRLKAFAGANILNDIYPSLVRKKAFVFLGYSSVRKGTSTVSFDGDLITYKYPVAFLYGVKSLVYSNGGTEVFR